MNSYRNPDAQWLGSPNFTVGRNGHDMTQPSWIVLHTMVGTADAANARFQQSSAQASATYGVKLDGSLVQWVDEANAAWANGATGRGGRGDNLDSISIEHEDNGDFNGPRTPALYAASSQLVRSICLRYNIPIDRNHIIGHRECDFAQTACPDSLDLDRIVTEAANGGDILTQAQADQLAQIWNMLYYFGDSRLPGTPKIGLIQNINDTLASLASVKTEIDAIKAELATGSSTSGTDATAIVARIEKALQSA